MLSLIQGVSGLNDANASDAVERRVDGCLIRIRGLFPTLRPSEQKVAQYILDNPSEVITLPVTDLARKSGVSDATVVKFCQRLGYSGYQHLKITLAAELASFPTPIYGEIVPGDELPVVKAKIFNMNKKSLDDTMRMVDDRELERAVEALLQAPRIHLYGVGASGLVALDAEHKLLRIGLDCHAFPDPHTAMSMASVLQRGDVAIGLSHSGATRDTVESLETARGVGATTICITNVMASPISKVADIKLYTSVEESDYRSGAMGSRIAQLSIIDVLFVGVAQRRFEETMEHLQKTRAAVRSKRIPT